MTRILRHTKRIITYPIRVGQRTLALNVKLWDSMFWETWYPLPMDQKLAWIAFVGQTIGVLTLLELFLLKK